MKFNTFVEIKKEFGFKLKISVPLLAVLLFLSIQQCFSQVDADNLTIEYRTISRGLYQKVTLDQTFIGYVRKSNVSTTDTLKMDGERWKRIVSLTKNIKLKELPYLKAPSEMRKHDGAAHAKLKIIVLGKVYESSSFDHGNPPETIRKLVGLITNIRGFD